MRQLSNQDGQLMRWRGKIAGSLVAGMTVLLATDASALLQTPFLYQDQAQRHCPDDTVVWLDFQKR